MKKLINVAAAVIIHDNKILAAKRGRSMTLPGFWEFPGGKIEAGETAEEALYRELREELNCTVEIGNHIDTSVYDYDFARVKLATYHATLLEGEPQLTEHEEIRWVAPQDLLTLKWAPADIPTAKKLFKQFK